MIKPWRHDKLARLTLTMLHYVRGGFVSLQSRLSPSAVRTTWSTEVAVAESLSTTTQSPATAVTTAVPPEVDSIHNQRDHAMKQIGIIAAFALALVISAIAYANNQDAETKEVLRSENVFAEKAIIITPTVGLAGSPKENVRVEILADRKFLVYTVKDDDGAYENWMAADQVSRIRAFPTMKEATEFYERQKENCNFH